MIFISYVNIEGGLTEMKNYSLTDKIGMMSDKKLSCWHEPLLPLKAEGKNFFSFCERQLLKECALFYADG